MSVRIAVVYEAAADFEMATGLADRVLLDTIPWLDGDSIDYHRVWVGSAGGQPFTWKWLKRAALAVGITAIGRFERQPAQPDAQAGRRALIYLRQQRPDHQFDAAMFVRDQDDQPPRRAGLEQARAEVHGKLPVVIGFAVAEREAWVLSGFDPANDAETARLNAVRTRVGFDPRTRSHDLDATKADTAHRSPKRALRELTGGDHTRERRCWQETPVSVLRERGAGNGLTDFLNEVRDLLAGLIG